jgi:tRNA pseudouridine13 synthase
MNRVICSDYFSVFVFHMKLKQLPEDFIVEELPCEQASTEKDEHTIFLLEKQEIDTFDAIRRIAGKLRISLFEIGYAGLKDKHALARQYISIPTRYNVQSLKMDGLVLSFVGYSRKKIKIGDLAGNRFTITVRDVSENELKDISTRAATIPICGVPNYFDSQRFGSVIDHGFIGKQVILKQYETAVKQYLTAYQKSEPKKIKDEKRKIESCWDDLSKVRVFNKAFATVIKEYLRTKDWRAAYTKIPAHLREMFVNAYQSYLWNECIKELLKEGIEKKKLYSVEYAIGALLFYTNLTEPEMKNIPDAFQTISDNALFSEVEQRIVSRVLAKENLSLSDFNIENETGNFFKTRPRQVLLIPGDFTISPPERDEINSKGNTQRKKIQVTFSLPKGSYATLVTKRLFNH